jgi:hypothetical protein
LARWEAEGIVEAKQATRLRESYERRRENLRAQLNINGKPAKQPASTPEAKAPTQSRQHQEQPPLPSSTDSPSHSANVRTTRRTLLEKLADPHTIRILLYAGAAMLVVGVVIWLRDILYLKLQEPLVQATLLAIGTIAVTVSGWLTILRTRLLLTGRALTLTGSLLVPVNFWFLARSGLIERSGRAWLVCALCALLYAHTAAFLREKLYVYLASLATIATVWTLVYRLDHEAFGLYALTLMAVSLVFLHLSRLFPAGTDDGRKMNDGEAPFVARLSSIRRPSSGASRLSYELWAAPLVHVALAGAAFSLLLYMPLRLGSSSNLEGGLFRLRANEYDSGIAILLSVAGAYAVWFTGRYIFTGARTTFYTMSALVLFWTEFIAADGLSLSGSIQLLLLATTALIFALMARVLKSDAWALALHRASLIVIVVLAAATYPVIYVANTSPFTHGLILILLVSTYAISGSPRTNSKTANETLAHVAIAFASAGLVIVQAITHLRVGDSLLLTPSVMLGAAGLLFLGVNLRLKKLERVRCFRAGLFAVILAFILAALHAGFDAFSDAEIYSSPVAILLLVVAYLSARRGWDEYAADTNLLLWAGSILLAAPLLIHALQYRLFLDVPAPWRDLTTLCAALALIIFGVMGRLRAPVLVGASVLALELSALALTSVDWLQIPLKAYLISTGGLILIIWGLLEFRHEQILLMRKRFNERREMARERFGEWK